MTDSEKELVAWLRTQKSVMHLECASAIERLTRERDEARADYEAMKAHNKELFGKLSAAEAEAARLREALAPFVTITKTDGPFWYYENADDSVVVRCELTVGEIRKARESLEGKQ